MRTNILRVCLFSLIAVAAAWAGPARQSNGSRGPGTLSRASISTPIAKHAIFDIGTIATAEPASLLGVEVVAVRVRVDELVDHGFWVTPIDSEQRIFVVPAEDSRITVRPGELVSVHGDVRLTRNLADGHEIPSRHFASLMPYVYAYTVRPAWPQGKEPAVRKNPT